MLSKKEVPVFIDPVSDFGFKRIFSHEPNKDLLIAFLNELFRGKKTIVDLRYDKNELVGDTEDLGTVVLDLTCTASGGEKFVIEVQRTSHANFKQRILYYGSKLIADQAPKGNRREWAYGISEVYVVVLMDGFSMPGEPASDQYLHDVCLCNRKTGSVFYEHLQYLFIELVNFDKEESELQSDLDRWLFVLKHMSKLNKIPVYLRKPIFEKLFHIAAYGKLNKKERDMYDSSLKRKWDAEVIRQYTVQQEEAAREAQEKLKNAQQELQQAQEQAKQAQEQAKQALEETKHAQKETTQAQEKAKQAQEEARKLKAENLKIALQLKDMGVPLDKIAKVTGLSLEKIEQL